MTVEHLSQTQLTGFSGRTLDPHELLAVDRHLASCEVCHERLMSILPDTAKAAFNTSFKSGKEPDEGPFHLDYEQHLEPYVDGKANDIDREIVDSHVAQCSQCAADLEDLLEFKRQPVPAIAGDARTSSRWNQWLAQLSLPSNRAWATVAVIAVFILGTAILLWTRYLRSAPVQDAEAVLPAPDKQNQTVEQDQPSPAATEHTTQAEAPSPSASGGLSVSPPEQPLLVLNDAGGQVILNQHGRLEGLQELPPDLKESIERALANRQLRASPALRGWSVGTNNLRSGIAPQNTFAPLGLTGVVIETDRPTFRWRALEGAQHYIVNIYDANLRKVGSSGPVSGTEWTTSSSLERGITYSWQVSALKDGETVVSPKPPLPEARFRVLDQHAVTALTKLKQSAGNSHLAMGVFYWKHGLIGEAEREFQALANANPDSSAARELLASIRSIRRR